MTLSPKPVRYQQLFVDNDNVIALNLSDLISGEYLTSATVTCALKRDSDSATVATLSLAYKDPGEIGAALLEKLGPDGNFFAVLQEDAALAKDLTYTAVIEGNDGQGGDIHFEVPCIGVVRTGL